MTFGAGLWVDMMDGVPGDSMEFWPGGYTGGVERRDLLRSQIGSLIRPVSTFARSLCAIVNTSCLHAGYLSPLEEAVEAGEGRLIVGFKPHECAQIIDPTWGMAPKQWDRNHPLIARKSPGGHDGWILTSAVFWSMVGEFAERAAVLGRGGWIALDFEELFARRVLHPDDVRPVAERLATLLLNLWSSNTRAVVFWPMPLEFLRKAAVGSSQVDLYAETMRQLAAQTDHPSTVFAATCEPHNLGQWTFREQNPIPFCVHPVQGSRGPRYDVATFLAFAERAGAGLLSFGSAWMDPVTRERPKANVVAAEFVLHDATVNAAATQDSEAA